MPLDCARFEEVVPDLDRSGTPGASLREAALAHAESCSRCAGLLTESESLDYALHSLAAHDAFRTAPPRVEAALLNRFRLEKGIAARRRLQWQLSLLGAAAAMLLVLGIAFHERHEISARRHSPTVATAPSRQQLGANHEGSAAGDGVFFAEAVDDDPDAGTFIPLPYADDPDADGGEVVRVVLSRSALASLGLPAEALVASDRIPADLVVSQDGTPQAIRLLAQDDSTNQN